MSTRRGFLGALFSALLALTLLDPGAAIAQEVKQIKLTEKHIQGFMAASKDMAKLYDGADPSADKPDPKVEAQAGGIAKKSGFASLAEYEDASMNIAMIMYGIDPQTKKFTEPSATAAMASRAAGASADRWTTSKSRGRLRAMSYSCWAMMSRVARVCGSIVERDNAKHCAAVSLSSPMRSAIGTPPKLLNQDDPGTNLTPRKSN